MEQLLFKVVMAAIGGAVISGIYFLIIFLMKALSGKKSEKGSD